MISEGRPPPSNTSSEAGALPLEGRIDNDADRTFSKSNFFIVFWKPLFSTFHVTLACHCKPKIYLRFFEVCTYPSIHNFELEAPSCNAISEGRPPLSNTSSEAGALPLEVRIENYSDRTFSKLPWPVIVNRKYIYGFSKSAPTPRYTILNSRPPLVMRSRKAGLPLATRARKRELCP